MNLRPRVVLNQAMMSILPQSSIRFRSVPFAGRKVLIRASGCEGTKSAFQERMSSISRPILSYSLDSAGKLFVTPPSTQICLR